MKHKVYVQIYDVAHEHSWIDAKEIELENNINKSPEWEGTIQSCIT